MKTFARLLVFFRPYQGRAALALAAMAVVSLASGATLFFSRSVFDDVLTAPGVPGVAAAERGTGGGQDLAGRGGALMRGLDRRYAVLKRDLVARGWSLSVTIPLLLLASLVVKNFFGYFSEFTFNGIGLAMVRDLRAHAYGRLIRQSSTFFGAASTGDLMSRLLSDVELIQNAFGTQIADLFQGALTLVVLLVYVFSLNARLAVFTLVVAPLVLWPVFEIMRRMRKAYSVSRERMGTIGTILQETLRGWRVVKTYGMEEFESGRFAKANRRYFRINLRAVRIQAVSSPLIEILASAGLASLFIYAGSRIASGRMTTGDVVSFVTALMMMYAPVKAITKVNLRIQQAISCADRVFAVTDAPNEVIERSGVRELPPFRDAVRFEDISFSYGDAPVLSHVNLAVRRGETVALVGPSGAGKTTLVNLLPRLYDPAEGRVTIDGADLREVTLASLRRQFALVTQETVLFDASVRANIAYGIADPSEEQVAAAARAAYAEEFIRALPQGYDTPLGENGARLSGGQRQRIAIARALFRDAPILILDEATSQLDAESESLVQQALANLMAGRTTFVIAHRLSTVRRADRIVVLDEGCVVDQGTHRELLARPGLYRRLYEMQYFDEGTGGQGPGAREDAEPRPLAPIPGRLEGGE